MEEMKMSEETRKVPCLVMSRVVGYYSAVQDWNKGKRMEWKERKVYKVEEEAECESVEELA